MGGVSTVLIMCTFFIDQARLRTITTSYRILTLRVDSGLLEHIGIIG